ncbi:MAG: hypothetical protein GY805_26060 [Chloroflexi bacterium]|nr:hypothetical protein [Chloroflexota bacterium]
MLKPGNIQLIAIIYLVDGLLNITWGVSIILGLFSSLIGLICFPIGFYPMALGVIEIVYGLKLLGDPVRLKKAPFLLSVLQLTTLEPIGMFLGAICLLLYNSKDIKAYFAFTRRQIHLERDYV